MYTCHRMMRWRCLMINVICHILRVMMSSVGAIYCKNMTSESSSSVNKHLPYLLFYLTTPPVAQTRGSRRMSRMTVNNICERMW